MFCEFSFLTVSAMLSRALRTSGYDLPGAESPAVPLIGYRPLSHDSCSLLGGDSSNNKLQTAQVSYHVVTWLMMMEYLSQNFLGFFLFVLIWFCFFCVVFSSFCFQSPLCVGGSSFCYCPHCFHLSSLTCVWSWTPVNPVKGCALCFCCLRAWVWLCVHW